MMKVIRFSRANGGYSAGEIAGFEPKVADRLVQAGFATYHKAEAVEDLAPEAVAESEESEESEESDKKKSKGRRKSKGVKAEKETAHSERPRLSTDAEPGNTYVTKDEG